MAFGVWMFLMLFVRREFKSQKKKCSISCTDMKVTFYITLALSLLLTALKLGFSLALLVDWVGGRFDKNYCDLPMKFLFWFESVAICLALLGCLLRFIYFYFYIDEQWKTDELLRMDEPRDPPKLGESNEEDEEDFGLANMFQ